MKVVYEELPAVFDPLDAIKEGAPVIHDRFPNNVSVTIRKEFGDIEKGFAASAFVFEDTFYSQAVNHAPMEPHAAMAQYDTQNGDFTIWTSTQIPYFLKRNLATTMGVPENKVRVIKPKVGGGFGQKLDMFAKDFCACWFARELGRPVKFVYDREEVFQTTRQRHPMYLTVKTGVNKRGKIMAQHITAHADGGAYNSTAPLMIALSCFFVMIPYKIENLVYEGYHVYTNKPVGGAMRGHGVPQPRFAIERQVDLIAKRIGVDPVEMRLLNAIKAGEPHAAGFVINTCGFAESVEEAAKAIGWKEKRGKLPFGRGIGLAGSGWPSGVANMAHLASGAVVQLMREGRVNVLSGAADIGQGAETVINQIVAEQLGVPMEDVHITAADTGICPLDAGTFGSGRDGAGRSCRPCRRQRRAPAALPLRGRLAGVRPRRTRSRRSPPVGAGEPRAGHEPAGSPQALPVRRHAPAHRGSRGLDPAGRPAHRPAHRERQLRPQLLLHDAGRRSGGGSRDRHRSRSSAW